MAVSFSTLLARQAALRAEMQAADEADPQNGTMSADQQSKFDALKLALVDLENALANRAAIRAFEEHEIGRVIQGGDKKLEIAKRAYRPEVGLAGRRKEVAGDHECRRVG